LRFWSGRLSVHCFFFGETNNARHVGPCCEGHFGTLYCWRSSHASTGSEESGAEAYCGGLASDLLFASKAGTSFGNPTFSIF